VLFVALDGPKALLISHMEVSDTLLISHMEVSDTAAVDGAISRLTSVLETTDICEFRPTDGSDISHTDV